MTGISRWWGHLSPWDRVSAIGIIVVLLVAAWSLAANETRMRQTVQSAAAGTPSRPWIQKGDEIWTGSTPFFTASLYAIDEVALPRRCQVGTFLRVTKLTSGCQVRSVREYTLLCTPEPDTDVTFRINTPDGQITTNVIIPSRIYRGGGIVMLGPPEIEITR